MLSYTLLLMVSAYAATAAPHFGSHENFLNCNKYLAGQVSEDSTLKRSLLHGYNVTIDLEPTIGPIIVGVEVDACDDIDIELKGSNLIVSRTGHHCLWRDIPLLITTYTVPFLPPTATTDSNRVTVTNILPPHASNSATYSPSS